MNIRHIYKLALLLFATNILFCLTVQAQIFHTEIGISFPEFSIEDIDGTLTNNKNLQGKPSLIVFFGTRCGPCLKELKALNKTIPLDWYSKFNIYAIGATDDAARLRKFNQKKNYKFKFLPDPRQDLFNQIGDNTIPRTFLLDSKGIILSQTLGFNKTPFDNLIAKMKSLL